MSQVAAVRGRGFALVATDTRWSGPDGDGFDQGGKTVHVPGVGFLACSGGRGGALMTTLGAARARFPEEATPKALVDLLRENHERELETVRARGMKPSPWIYGLAATGPDGPELWIGAGPEWGLSRGGPGKVFTPSPPGFDGSHTDKWNEAVEQLSARHVSLPDALPALGLLFHAGGRSSSRVSRTIHAGIVCEGRHHFLEADSAALAKATESEIMARLDTLELGASQGGEPSATQDPAVIEEFQVLDWAFSSCPGGMDITMEWKISNWDSSKFTISLEFWADWDADGVDAQKQTDNPTQDGDTTPSTDHYTWTNLPYTDDGVCAARDSFVKIIVTRDSTGEVVSKETSRTIRFNAKSCLDDTCASGE